MSLVFWVWVVIAALLALGETVTGGLIVLPWALGAVVAAGLEALHVGVTWEWIAFVGVSSVVLVAVQRLLARKP